MLFFLDTPLGTYLTKKPKKKKKNDVGPITKLLSPA
jgi:hypothetical protein